MTKKFKEKLTQNDFFRKHHFKNLLAFQYELLFQFWRSELPLSLNIGKNFLHKI